MLFANCAIFLDHNGGGAFYLNKYVLSFYQYTTKLQHNYLVIAKYINETAPEKMAQRILDGIRLQVNIATAMATNCITGNIMSDWINDVSYISTKVTMILPPQSGGKQKSNDGCNGH